MPDKLAILVPDGAYELVLPVLLTTRHHSIGIRPIEFVIHKDVFHDSSREAASLMRAYITDCSHFMLFRDLHGSGWEQQGAPALEEKLTTDLVQNGCPPERTKVIIVDPEIECWLRFGSTQMAAMIKARARFRRDEVDMFFASALEEVVIARGGSNQLGKPVAPKEAFADILKHYRINRSNALYEHLAGVESLRNCQESSMSAFIETLQAWFPATP